MTRKAFLILAATALPSLLLVTVGSSVAQAVPAPVLIGFATCSPAGGVWHGKISFVPPLKNGGTANNEKMVIAATLGNTGSLCVPSSGVVLLGKITGKLKFHIPGSANKCATIFSGAALPTPVGASKFKLTWNPPAGSTPTHWTQPVGSPFVVTGALAMNDIAITGGSVAGSFAPYANPTATLSDTTWPGLAGAVATGCASAAGLGGLTLSTSTGTW